MREYRAKLKRLGIRRSWNSPDYYRNLRLRVMEVLGGPQCVNCGCTNIKILEINHRKGGGSQESSQGKRLRQMYRDIIYGRVRRSRYNVLCKVCNALHYVRDILKIKGHAVTWAL
jgi:hypothetical protein